MRGNTSVEAVGDALSHCARVHALIAISRHLASRLEAASKDRRVTNAQDPAMLDCQAAETGLAKVLPTSVKRFSTNSTCSFLL